MIIHKTIFNYLLIYFFTLSASVAAQETTPDYKLQVDRWNANWITHPDIDGEETGVYLFKKIISVAIIPEQFKINISADNRYRLYVNGKYVENGPARGDFFKWRYETIDIAPYLEAGENAIAVKVWNMGSLRPGAQFTVQTGLIIQGSSEEEEVINTNKSWQVMLDTAYDFRPIQHLNTYYVVGPGEIFNANDHNWSWLDKSFESSQWKSARELEQGQPLGSLRKYGTPAKWSLYRRDIPFMEYKKQAFAAIRKQEGTNNATALLNEEKDFIIPANNKVKILLDQQVLTTAYPYLKISDGKDATIKITYAESLFKTTTKNGKQEAILFKGNRDEVDDKVMRGNFDEFISDGGTNRHYEPLWWRTFRYVELDISTSEQPLKIHQFHSYFTAYPLKKLAGFETDQPLISDIFDVSWRTQRLCAAETFFDCPYYEQLQYVGDTRVQALSTYFASGDTLLWRKAITDFYDSRLPFGLTQSRYPGYDMQIIPTYSLAWITMLWDYMQYGNDENFVSTKLPAVVDILLWFQMRQKSNDLHGKIEGWNFVDWVIYQDWDSGVPPLDNGANSSVIGLQYVYTIQKAVEMFRHFGMNDIGQYWSSIAEKTKKSIYENCWDDSHNMIADTPEKKNFSQHANLLAVLADAIPVEQQKDLVKRTFEDTTIAQASYYFKFYLAEALKKTEMRESYLDMLNPWEEMLNNGLTTFQEEPDPSRSDCHAWSASPLYHFYTIVCGIDPQDPGFKNINISPSFGELKWIKAKLPHRSGLINIDLNKKKNGRVIGEIILPDHMNGTFYWDGTAYALISGVNKINY